MKYVHLFWVLKFCYLMSEDSPHYLNIYHMLTKLIQFFFFFVVDGSTYVSIDMM